MRAAFGIVSLLVVLAIVGLLSRTQMKVADQAAAAASAPTGGDNVRQQAAQIQGQVTSEIGKAADQAAEARDKALDK